MEQITYEKASEELEQILFALKNEQVSVDELAIKVERASKLIIYCKEKLSDTQNKVEEIIDKLEL